MSKVIVLAVGGTRGEEDRIAVYKERVRGLSHIDVVRNTIDPLALSIGQPNKEFRAICQQSRRRDFGNFAQLISPLPDPIDRVNNRVSPLLNQGMRWINEAGQLSDENRKMFYQWCLGLRFRIHREFWVSYIKLF